MYLSATVTLRSNLKKQSHRGDDMINALLQPHPDDYTLTAYTFPRFLFFLKNGVKKGERGTHQ